MVPIHPSLVLYSLKIILYNNYLKNILCLACNVKSYKNLWKKHSEITFYRQI
jgi:hypothetical protein